MTLSDDLAALGARVLDADWMRFEHRHRCERRAVELAGLLDELLGLWMRSPARYSLDYGVGASIRERAAVLLRDVDPRQDKAEGGKA